MKRIISISLLLIFLSGQFNLTWATQFCGESEVKSSFMLGHGQLDCCEGSCDDSDDHTDGASSIVASSCCRVDYYSAESDDYFNQIKTLGTSYVLFSPAFVISFFENADSVNHKNYFIAESPPLIPDDLQVLHQNFLLWKPLNCDRLNEYVQSIGHYSFQHIYSNKDIITWNLNI